MNRKYYIVFAFLLLCSGNHLCSQALINAAGFGVKPNSFENASYAIRKAIAACEGRGEVVLQLPGGRIDLWPEGAEKRELYVSNATENDTFPKVKSIAFLFEGCKNITLNGNHSLVVLHGKMVSFAVLNSINIKISNIRFDYERPTMSELTIRSVTDTAIETAIHPDSKYTINDGLISFYGEGWKTRNYHTILFDPAKETMHYSSLTALTGSKAVEVSPFRVKFTGNFIGTKYRTGDVLTFRDPYRDNCGAFISHSKDIALEHVTMHYMHGLGIVSQFSENISLLKVEVAPRKNSGRVIASFADCFHFSGCKGLVKIDSCYTSGSHDDPVNVHGTHLQIVTADASSTMKVRFMHNQTYGFAAFFAGDSIAFINPKTLLPLGYAKLRKAKLVNKREMEIAVEGSLPAFVNAGLCIENITWTPQVIIRNSRFERTNTRGVLVTTRRSVLIENNVFYHTGMFPVLIADDALSWYESGAVQDVTIRNNLFEDCGYNSGSGAIKIAPENHESVAGKMVHRNIRIDDNIFKTNNGSVLWAKSVDRLRFSGNQVIVTEADSKQSPVVRIDLMSCKNVLIEKNKLKARGTPVINTFSMSENDIKTDWR